LAFFGCSFTYGWGVEDTETFPYLVQKELSNFKVENYSVPGYGTIQALQQIRHIPADKFPKTVVLVYGSFHDHRNGLSLAQRKFWSTSVTNQDANPAYSHIQFPCLENANSHEISFIPSNQLYEPCKWCKKLATINFIENYSYRITDSKRQLPTISLQIIEKINHLVKRHNSRLIVAGILDNEETALFLNQLKEKGVECIDISVNTENPDYNLLPFDEHPNALAHEKYAQTFLKFFHSNSL
ncbi:MAG: SGNH/GDSL hydrolase family protein, partial [Bacteroidetes bacterium]|nr:SGNH/GDSL hydrolase family protein [Bacteroidota bacterium]